jgi:hypothetical protein
MQWFDLNDHTFFLGVLSIGPMMGTAAITLMHGLRQRGWGTVMRWLAAIPAGVAVGISAWSILVDQGMFLCPCMLLNLLMAAICAYGLLTQVEPPMGHR